MNDDLTPFAAALSERLHEAASAIVPGRPPVDVLRRRFIRRQRRTRAGLAGTALAGAAAVVATPNLAGAPAGLRQGQEASRRALGPGASGTPATGTSNDRSAAGVSGVTVQVGGYRFTLPEGFRVTAAPTLTRLAPSVADPSQEGGTSYVLVGEAPPPAGHASQRQITIAVYRGGVARTANGKTATDLFGTTPSHHVVVAGRTAQVATVTDIPVDADGLAEFKLSLDRRADVPAGASCVTRGLPASLVCRLAPQQAQRLGLIAPRPGIDLELQIGPDEHLSVHTSGIAESSVVELVADALRP